MNKIIDKILISIFCFLVLQAVLILGFVERTKNIGVVKHKGVVLGDVVIEDGTSRSVYEVFYYKVREDSVKGFINYNVNMFDWDVLRGDSVEIYYHIVAPKYEWAFLPWSYFYPDVIKRHRKVEEEPYAIKKLN